MFLQDRLVIQQSCIGIFPVIRYSKKIFIIHSKTIVFLNLVGIQYPSTDVGASEFTEVNKVLAGLWIYY